MLGAENLYPEMFPELATAYHELMAVRIDEILLVSSPYDAFIIEEDGNLAERIIHEYKGLNLSKPPRLTWASTAKEALGILADQNIDLVITMLRLDDMDTYRLCRKIKQKYPTIPVYLLAHDAGRVLLEAGEAEMKFIDRTFIWRGNTDLLVALVKSTEDRINGDTDTRKAMVRVIILVEDSPLFVSYLLPFLYKELVMQTQAVMEESLNEKHRLMRMRARPKILIATTYEEAWALYEKYYAYLHCVISDVRYRRKKKLDDQAGFDLLTLIKKRTPDLSLLMLSTEENNREKAQNIPAVFLNKNAPSLYADIRYFFMQYLGFGDFVFRQPDGKVVARASNLRTMGHILPTVPEESIYYHAKNNHFSTWLMARFEMALATHLRRIDADSFQTPKDVKAYLIEMISKKLIGRQKGIITDFSEHEYHPENDFIKIGRGSLGGKARGLAFATTLLEKEPDLKTRYPNMRIGVPKTLVIATEWYDHFVDENQIKTLDFEEMSDEAIVAMFVGFKFPEPLKRDLELFLTEVDYPLAVRSSSLMEDAYFRPFAGLFKTFMIPNQHQDLNIRLKKLICAIKMVYASLFGKTPRTFQKEAVYRMEEDKMAIIIQELTGQCHPPYFYPAMSGVAQSHNFYPVQPVKPGDGIVHLALGFGQTVVEGGAALRFSPKYPKILRQFATIDDYLSHSQRQFYALNMEKILSFSKNEPDVSGMSRFSLTAVDITEVLDHYPVRFLASTYIPEDHQIRDSFQKEGLPVLTFASVLKYRTLPLCEILTDILAIGQKGMGCPVEIEFAVNLAENEREEAELTILQIRPMVVSRQNMDVVIQKEDYENAVLVSPSVMGKGQVGEITDVVYVKPDAFDVTQTQKIAQEIGRINKNIGQQGRQYVLIGPGRWGTADRFLGIPVDWHDISNVATIVETHTDTFQAAPSQGAHFFHNMTSLEINYITLSRDSEHYLDQKWFDDRAASSQEMTYTRHIHFEVPLVMKLDGKQPIVVIRTQMQKEDH